MMAALSSCIEGDTVGTFVSNKRRNEIASFDTVIGTEEVE